MQYGRAARELGQAFAQLVLLDIGRGGLVLALHLGAAGGDQLGLAARRE